jgi:hypothetical protein
MAKYLNRFLRKVAKKTRKQINKSALSFPDLILFSSEPLRKIICDIS